MVFTRNSGLVKVWVSVIMQGTYTLAQVPELYNLKVVVTEVVNELTA